MPVYIGTRYENAEMFGIKKVGESAKTFVYAGKKEVKEDSEYEVYTQRMNEYIDLIAAIHLDNPLLYHRICDINDLLDPFEIIEGRALLIPPTK